MATFICLSVRLSQGAFDAAVSIISAGSDSGDPAAEVDFCFPAHELIVVFLNFIVLSCSLCQSGWFMELSALPFSVNSRRVRDSGAPLLQLTAHELVRRFLKTCSGRVEESRVCSTFVLPADVGCRYSPGARHADHRPSRKSFLNTRPRRPLRHGDHAPDDTLESSDTLLTLDVKNDRCLRMCGILTTTNRFVKKHLIGAARRFRKRIKAPILGSF